MAFEKPDVQTSLSARSNLTFRGIAMSDSTPHDPGAS